MHEELTGSEEDFSQLSDLSKRSAETSPPSNNSSRPGMPELCRTEVWQCMSGVLETGIPYVERPSDIYSSLQPVLYKAVFHGGVKSMWSSVMEVRQTEQFKSKIHMLLMSALLCHGIKGHLITDTFNGWQSYHAITTHQNST